jgi:high-affinity K+ transport system ATPase subunit B
MFSVTAGTTVISDWLLFRVTVNPTILSSIA